MKTVQMFFEDCAAPSVRGFFSLSCYFHLSCVVLCKKGKRTTRIKCEIVSKLT